MRTLVDDPRVVRLVTKLMRAAARLWSLAQRDRQVTFSRLTQGGQ